MSGSASVSINALVTPDVTISTGVGDTVCSGHLITFTAMAVNGGGSPLYQWTVNGSVTGAGSIYSYMPADGDMVGVRLTSNATCATPATASATIAMNVNTEQSPVVTVTANPGTMVCSGTAVTFTAAPLYGGSAPTYSWIVNGINSGTASTLNYTPLNGDVVYCIMGSNYHCRLANSATSTQITMQVDMPVMPVVTVTPNPGGNIPAGHTVTFTAAVTSGGSSPSFQWSVNSNPVAGATMQTYTTTSLSNNDVVSCQVTAGGACPGMVGTNSVTVHIIGVGVNPVTISEADIRLIPNPNSGTFTIKGNTGSVTSEEVSLEITDMVGQVIYNSKVMTHNGDINERIQLNNTVANGMYLLNIRTTTGNKVFHIVVEQ